MTSRSISVLTVSTSILSIALLLRISVPLLSDFYVYRAPLLWSSFSSWLKPPYLYIVLNCIIITIAATSCFHHHRHRHEAEEEERKMPVVANISALASAEFEYDMKVSVPEIEPEFGGPEAGGEEEEEEVEEKSVVEVEEEFVISRSTWMPPKRREQHEEEVEVEEDNLLPESFSPAEKPLVSVRFGHRKPVKASPEGGGRALRRVSKPKRHETLENTWKMITEGRAMPLTRHMKKCDTWENQERLSLVEVDAFAAKKSETFKDRTNYQQPPAVTPSLPPPPGRPRKEPSLSQDELNRRVEAFIKKFNEDMRLQRQESLNQYKEIISRGAH